MTWATTRPRRGGATFATDVVRGRESKAERVYAALKQAIVSGQLSPDTLIDKAEWSARLQVSRLSVTTAVNRLAFERLVVVEPQRGTFVSKIRLSDVKQWMLVRRTLEAEVVGLCARELPEPSLRHLRRNLVYQRTALESGDVQGFHELDNLFHLQMTEGLGLARVGEVLDPFRTHLERVRRTLLPEPGRMDATFAEHEAIYQAIAGREPAVAQAAMNDHLSRVLRELESFVARHPAFFEP